MLKRSFRKWISNGIWISVLFVIFFFVMDRWERSHISDPEFIYFNSKNYTVNKNPIDYTDYTVRRLGLKPIISVSPLEPDIKEPVINDVLSFQYPIDIDGKCRQWGNTSLLDTITTNFNRTLLVVVISAAEHMTKRNLIRKTWADPNMLDVEWIQIIFLVGTTLREDKILDERLQQENAEHKDLVQVNVVDSYANLTLKSVALLHWAHSHCPGAQLVLKCDDDNYINWNVMSKILPNFNDTRSIYGTPVPTLYAERWKNHKHYVSRRVWPWPRYPNYLFGGCYAIAGQAVKSLLAATQTTPFFWIEDIYLTGLCASKVNVSLQSQPKYYYPDIPEKNQLNSCFVRKTAIWQTRSSKQLAKSHAITSSVYSNQLPCNPKSNNPVFKCNWGIFC